MPGRPHQENFSLPTGGGRKGPWLGVCCPLPAGMSTANFFGQICNLPRNDT